MSRGEGRGRLLSYEEQVWWHVNEVLKAMSDSDRKYAVKALAGAGFVSLDRKSAEARSAEAKAREIIAEFVRSGASTEQFVPSLMAVAVEVLIAWKAGGGRPDNFDTLALIDAVADLTALAPDGKTDPRTAVYVVLYSSGEGDRREALALKLVQKKSYCQIQEVAKTIVQVFDEQRRRQAELEYPTTGGSTIGQLYRGIMYRTKAIWWNLFSTQSELEKLGKRQIGEMCEGAKVTPDFVAATVALITGIRGTPRKKVRDLAAVALGTSPSDGLASTFKKLLIAELAEAATVPGKLDSLLQGTKGGKS